MDVCLYEHLVSGKLHLAFEPVMRPGIALLTVSAQKLCTYNKGPSSDMYAEVVI